MYNPAPSKGAAGVYAENATLLT